VFYASIFPRLARNTQRTKDARAKLDRGEIDTETYETTEMLERNRLSTISTAHSNCTSISTISPFCLLCLLLYASIPRHVFFSLHSAICLVFRGPSECALTTRGLHHHFGAQSFDFDPPRWKRSRQPIYTLVDQLLLDNAWSPLVLPSEEASRPPYSSGRALADCESKFPEFSKINDIFDFLPSAFTTVILTSSLAGSRSSRLSNSTSGCRESQLCDPTSRKELIPRHTFTYLGAFFLLADGLNTTGFVIGIVQNEHIQFSFLESTYLGLSQAATSTLSCYVFWYIQRHFKIQTKWMFGVTNVITVFIPLWGMVSGHPVLVGLGSNA